MTVLVWMTTIADNYMSGHYTFLYDCSPVVGLVGQEGLQADTCAYIVSVAYILVLHSTVEIYE